MVPQHQGYDSRLIRLSNQITKGCPKGVALFLCIILRRAAFLFTSFPAERGAFGEGNPPLSRKFILTFRRKVYIFVINILINTESVSLFSTLNLVNLMKENRQTFCRVVSIVDFGVGCRLFTSKALPEPSV
jgi:hypothetical protein